MGGGDDLYNRRTPASVRALGRRIWDQKIEACLSRPEAPWPAPRSRSVELSGGVKLLLEAVPEAPPGVRVEHQFPRRLHQRIRQRRHQIGFPLNHSTSRSKNLSCDLGLDAAMLGEEAAILGGGGGEARDGGG
jgi:hypothetical protein